MEKLYEESSFDKTQDMETDCCPRFNTEPWDEKEVIWENKLFLKDRVFSIFHVPLNFGKVMVKNMEKIKTANALVPEPLMLSDENSLFGSDLYIATSKDVPGSEMVKISGAFLTKVFKGSYKNMGQWIKQMQGFVKSQGKEIKKMYFFYTTCPKCAKYYGKNYTVILAQV